MVDSLKYDSTKFEEEATGYRHRYQEPPGTYEKHLPTPHLVQTLKARPD